MAEFTGNIILHIAVLDNVVADTLSHPPQSAGIVAAVAATPQALDYTAIAKAQRDCPSIQAGGDSSLTSQLIPFGTIRVLCNTSGCYPRPIIPLGHHRQVFDAFHSVAHPRARGPRRILNERVVWPCMNKDVMEWVKDFHSCA